MTFLAFKNELETIATRQPALKTSREFTAPRPELLAAMPTAAALVELAEKNEPEAALVALTMLSTLLKNDSQMASITHKQRAAHVPEKVGASTQIEEPQAGLPWMLRRVRVRDR